MVDGRIWSNKHITAIAIAVLTCLQLFACAAPPRNALPEDLVTSARIPGLARAYDWGDEVPQDIDEAQRSLLEELASMEESRKQALLEGGMDFLAISGGGGNGAYGAGILNGWSKTGTRPSFDLVTGISTGAIIAPFAFLGPDYDWVLREIYTQYRTEDALQYRSTLGTLFGDSAAVASGMVTLIQKYFTDEVIQKIAEEHNKGRTLAVGTTNLDSGRPVVWNIGYIAASGAPHAVQLIQDIILASASIPGILPPVMIEYVADGERYEEMHVDGGVTRQVFLFSGQFSLQDFLQKLGFSGDNHLYIIMNGKLEPERKVVKPSIFAISARSIETLIKNQFVGDMYRLYLLSQKNDMHFQLTHIPASFSETPSELFDREYMQALFALGLEEGQRPDHWQHTPPEFLPGNNGKID